MIRRTFAIHTAATAIAAALAIQPATVRAQDETTQDYDLPSRDLAGALQEVAARTGRNLVVAADLVADRRSPPLRGSYTTLGAVEALLAGTSLAVSETNGTLVITDTGRGFGEASQDGNIVVTGTRIRGRDPVGSAVIRIDRSSIGRSGHATTQDIVQAIPQNFGGAPNEGTAAISLDPNSGKNTASGSSINLRGLGNSSTLLLLNGDRPPLGGFGGVFGDISLIPASAIERIEVIADGASAIYGSDAVAGVVNVIPRLRFEGAETSVRVGSTDGDAREIVASQIAGGSWATGHAVLAYEYYRRSALAADDRAFVSDDLTALGGPDLRGTYANPGTIVAGGQTFAIPAGQDGTALSPGDFEAGSVNLGDSWSMVDVLPRQRRHSVFAAGRQELGGALSLYAQGLFSSRSFDRRSRTATDAPRLVPVTNPFHVDPTGAGAPVLVQYDFGADLGRERRIGEVEAYGLTLGLEAELDRWSVDLRGNFGRQREESTILNRVNSARLALALADPDPATAYNLFGDGPSTNPATVDFVRGSTSTSSSGKVWSGTLRADGPLASLPAGEVRVAFGGEFRSERYRDGGTVNDTVTLEPQMLEPIALPGSRRIAAGYAEALVPVFGDGFAVPGFRRLDLSVAVRTEHYSDFGGTTNPRVAFSWEPLGGVRLRGTYGTSFRAPNFDNLRQDPGTQLLFAFTIPDPASPTGQTNILVQRGNDPELGPEEATTWTLGADVEPRFLEGFRLRGTYFDIDYRGRIASPAANLFNFLVNRETYAGIIEDDPSEQTIAAFYASPFFANPLGITPETIEAVVDARLQNLSVVRQSGIDMDLQYAFDLAGGRAEAGASGTYIFRIDQALTPTAPSSNVVDVLGNPVDLRVRGRLLWDNERWSASLFVNYLDSYTNLTNATPQTVGSWTTFDAQVGYRLPAGPGPLAGLRVALGATNLFDADPPFAVYNLGLLATGYDPDNASPLGRVVSLQVTKSW